MPSHLSKANRQFLETEIIPILKATKETISLTCDAERIYYILKTARTNDEYRWLSTKFAFRKKDETTLVCKVKSPVISVTDSINEYGDRVDILDIINLLIQDKPASIRFTNAFLTENEELKLGAYCRENNYILTKDKRGLTLIHE